ncbi:hypothetical protein BCU70_10725 [Vibrio sp. 10N.286.49.C2]|uniref:hypothetical protein n=1 Tax=unclassified Vibrio TaxID=2614977 RepID=UPI000C865312|nr:MULTISPECIES: hypothetical protein [unclassified Vibrio]PMH40632.1 hypothetical protein BCU70_10725 [Vibrio sp. 10N.286.49.C2]PMH45163.1 hypothetical protein BCU66_02325 [Vibrio sp. 10N.286.49.B1]PMH81834.1 hypothetical protein BCU58_20250 [Vibrio sp. 10N.286.48.B7]
MIVNFTLLENQCSWSATIHQLNGDILLRHLLLKGQVNTMAIDFSYCEDTQQGTIINNYNELIGSFSISS